MKLLSFPLIIHDCKCRKTIILKQYQTHLTYNKPGTYIQQSCTATSLIHIKADEVETIITVIPIVQTETEAQITGKKSDIENKYSKWESWRQLDSSGHRFTSGPEVSEDLG